MKITYEEARKVLTRYCNRCASHIPLKTLRYNDFAEKMDIMIKPVYDFIDQHKPPTYEEVVKAWEELGLDEVIERGTELYFRNEEGYEVCFEVKELCYEYGGYISIEMHNAINLTMRFLESL